MRDVLDEVFYVLTERRIIAEQPVPDERPIEIVQPLPRGLVRLRAQAF